MFSKAPNRFTFVRIVTENNAMSRDGETWHPSRPSGFYSIGNRLRCAWLVFTGRADALIWPAGQ
jgi:hypothetical protein